MRNKMPDVHRRQSKIDVSIELALGKDVKRQKEGAKVKQ